MLSAAVIRTSAPGRVGLIGGYSVLELGHASFSFTVDARVHAEIKESTDGNIHIQAPQFDLNTQAAWEKDQLILEKDIPAAAFAKASVQAAFEYLTLSKKKIKPFVLSTKTDAPFTQGGGKSGLGSSAAATVAMVHAVLAWHGISSLSVTHHCAQMAHSRAQGKVGSGYDVSASVFGSQEYKRYSPALVDGFPKNADRPWDYFVRSLEVPGCFHAVYATFPKESASTVSMTKLVHAWKKAHPQDYADLMHDLNDANVNAIAYLEQLGSEPTTENFALFKKYFETGRSLLRELGEKSGAPIEPPDVTRLIQRSLENGAFVCKAPGAGGKDGLVALCKTSADVKKLKAFWTKKGLEPLDVRINNEGVRIG